MTQKKETVKPIDWRIVVAGIGGLVVLECFALYNGINGTLLKAVMAAIGIVIGITIPNPIRK